MYTSIHNMDTNTKSLNTVHTHTDTYTHTRIHSHESFNRKQHDDFSNLHFVYLRTKYPNYMLVNRFISRFQSPLAANYNCNTEKGERRKTHTINFLWTFHFAFVDSQSMHISISIYTRDADYLSDYLLVFYFF